MPFRLHHDVSTRRRCSSPQHNLATMASNASVPIDDQDADHLSIMKQFSSISPMASNATVPIDDQDTDLLDIMTQLNASTVSELLL